METKVFDGRAAAAEIKADIKKVWSEFVLNRSQNLKLTTQNLNAPHLAVVLIGSDPASLIYIKQKKKACEEMGFVFSLHQLPETTTEAEVRDQLSIINSHLSPNGIILQLPLPAHLPVAELTSLILPEKDVDGVTLHTSFIPPTAQAVEYVLVKEGLGVKDKKIVVLGRGRTAGWPITHCLYEKGGSVFVIHSETDENEKRQNLAEADIIVSCVGQPGIIRGEMVKEGVVVIGVGLAQLPLLGKRVARPEGVPSSERNVNEDVGRDEGVAGPATKPKLVGDLDEPSLIGKARLITPTPGGIGPLTVAFLLKNLVLAAIKQRKNH